MLVTRDLMEESAPVDWDVFLLGGAIAAVSAYQGIHFFIRLLARTGMLPYVIYRLLLGTVLFVLFWQAFGGATQNRAYHGIRPPHSRFNVLDSVLIQTTNDCW